MTPDLLDLGRRAVACPRWRWLPGTRWTAPLRAGGYGPAGNSGRIGDDGAEPHDPDAAPDLDDPATGGAMLALLGESAWRVAPSADGGGYRALVGNYGNPEYHPTLARACLAVAVSLGRWPGGCK